MGFFLTNETTVKPLPRRKTPVMRRQNRGPVNRQKCTESPFGVLIAEYGPAKDVCPFRFSTKYYDPETELYYYGYRYYDPATCKWLSNDPIQERGGYNLTCFCRNDPINKWDPDGCEPHEFSYQYGGGDENFAAEQFVEALVPDPTPEPPDPPKHFFVQGKGGPSAAEREARKAHAKTWLQAQSDAAFSATQITPGSDLSIVGLRASKMHSDAYGAFGLAAVGTVVVMEGPAVVVNTVRSGQAAYSEAGRAIYVRGGQFVGRSLRPIMPVLKKVGAPFVPIIRLVRGGKPDQYPQYDWPRFQRLFGGRAGFGRQDMRQLRYFYEMHLKDPERFFAWQKTTRALLDAGAYWGHVANPSLADRLVTIDAALQNRESILAGIGRATIEGAMNYYVTPPPAGAVYFTDPWGELGARAPALILYVCGHSHSVVNGLHQVTLQSQ